jgi:hypothetical protein
VGEEFVLPLGVIQGGGTQKSIVLNPMTAGIRRKLLSRSNQKNPSAGMTTMMCECCESIGGAQPTPQVLNSISIGDRDFILLMIRKISLGNILNAQLNCPRCQQDIVFDLDIDQMNIRSLEIGKDFTVEGTYAFVELDNEELGLKIVLRLPVGFDQAAVSDQMRTDPVLANYELYARLIKSWTKNGTPVENPNSVKFLDSLPLKEIEWLENAFRSTMPGPDWYVNVTCEICGRKSMLDLSDTDFLFKTPR